MVGFWVCLTLGLLAQSASSAPNTQLKNLLEDVKSKFEEPALSAEHPESSHGSGTSARSPSAQASASLAEANGRPPSDVDRPAPPSLVDAPRLTSPSEDAETPAASSTLPSSGQEANPANDEDPGQLSGARSSLYPRLTPVQIPENVPGDALPPGAIPIKVDNGKVTYAVVGRKIKSEQQQLLLQQSDDEILRTTLFQKLENIVRHLYLIVRKFFEAQFSSAKNVVMMGGRAIGNTVDSTKSSLAKVFSILANLLRQLADHIESLPTNGVWPTIKFIFGLPLLPLRAVKALFVPVTIEA